MNWQRIYNVVSGLAIMVLLVGQTWTNGIFKEALENHKQAIEIAFMNDMSLSESYVAMEERVNELEHGRFHINHGTSTITLEVTGYSNDPISINVPEWRDGRTATGTLARRGVAAADWRVYPPGTRLFVPDYGEVVVEDRGGAVKGQRLDLFFDSREEALQWGRRNVEVRVIEMGKKGRWRV